LTVEELIVPSKHDVARLALLYCFHAPGGAYTIRESAAETSINDTTGSEPATEDVECVLELAEVEVVVVEELVEGDVVLVDLELVALAVPSWLLEATGLDEMGAALLASYAKLSTANTTLPTVTTFNVC
jgi:hypothetical protein